MNKLLKKIALCSAPVWLLALSGQTYAWTMIQDCEGGPANTLPSNSSTSYWGTNSRYSTEQINTGKQSCKFSIAQGSEGWPSSGGPLEWGAIFPLPSNVSVGQEVWMRVNIFMPTGFQISTNSGMLKFMRLHTKTSTANTGCLDLLMGATNGISIWDTVLKKDTFPPFVLNFEGNPGNTMVGTRPTNDVGYGKWESYEIYVKVDSVSKANGGMGEVRAWKNNQLMADVTTQTSAGDKTGVIDSLYLFTYWNGTSPSNQYLYMDDLIITTDTPANRDAKGNAFIGGNVVSSNPVISAPQSPSNFSVIKTI